MGNKQVMKTALEAMATIADVDEKYRDTFAQRLDMTYGDFLLSLVLEYTKMYRECPGEIFKMKVKDLISKSI